MNKKKIELQVLNISNSQAQAGAYALVLGEVGSKRQLPIIIGATEAQAMVIEMKGIVPPRPLTHNLFASVLEVPWQCADDLSTRGLAEGFPEYSPGSVCW